MSSEPIDIKTHLADLLRAALASVAPGTEVEIHLERPRDTTHGDFASNLAMQLARALKENPRKIAERLVIEMRDRLKILAGPALVAGSGGAAVMASNPQTEAFSALVSLGYKPAEVSRLLQKVDPAVTSTEELIRHALRAAAS